MYSVAASCPPFAGKLAFAHKIVLVNVALAAGIGLHAADGHDTYSIRASRRRLIAVSEVRGE